VEQNILDERPRTVRTRFELAASRMVEAWLNDGRVHVSAGDLALAREFLEQQGCRVERSAGAYVTVVNRDGRSAEMTREDAVVLAVRRLAARAA
jgi:hypothetical protein